MKRAKVIGPLRWISARIDAASASLPPDPTEGAAVSRRHSTLIESAPGGRLIDPVPPIRAGGCGRRLEGLRIRSRPADVSALVGGGRHDRLTAIAEHDRATDRISV